MGTHDASVERSRCARRALAITTLVAATSAVAGCSSGDYRGPVEIVEYHLTDERNLLLIVATCHGDPEVTSLQVEQRRVTVEVTSTSREVGDGCLDQVPLTLDKPLGDRAVVEASTERVVPRA